LKLIFGSHVLAYLKGIQDVSVFVSAVVSILWSANIGSFQQNLNGRTTTVILETSYSNHKPEKDSAKLEIIGQ